MAKHMHSMGWLWSNSANQDRFWEDLSKYIDGYQMATYEIGPITLGREA